MVVWSSIPKSQESQKKKTTSGGSLNFVIDKTPDFSKLHMLKGDYPQKWLGNWFSGEKKKAKNNTSNKNKLKVNEKKQEQTQTSDSIPSGKLREIVIDGVNVARSYVFKFFIENKKY